MRFWIYAAGEWPRKRGTPVWSTDLAAPGSTSSPQAGDGLPPWMVELANGLRLFPGELPTGAIVGSAVIENVSRGHHGFEWYLTGVERVKRLLKPKGHPQPVWFRPF